MARENETMKPGMFHQTPRNTLSFDTMKQGHVSPNTPILIMFRHNETMKLSIVGKAWLGVYPTANLKQLR